MRTTIGIWKWQIIAAVAAAVMAAVFAVSASAATQTKVALVIGNGAYKGVPELTNPTNDATAVAGAFLRLGFSVRLVTDASYDDMRRALLEFSQKARDSEMAVVFFAGHGIELGGENWLIPVDAELKTDLDTEQEAISLRSVMLMVSAASKLGVVMLDACRNNPFINKVRRSIATRAVTRGLSRVEPMNNVLVAYAAKDGTTASDGSGDHSPFTTALLKHIETPGLEVTFLFRNVRDDVIAATGNEQLPFVYGSLSKEAIYFKPPPAVAAPAAPDQLTWSLIKDTTDATALKRFITQYPKSDLRMDAEARIAALEAAQAAKPVPPKPDEATWALLKETTDEAALKRFTTQYPNSALRKDAEARIAALAAAQAAKPTPPGPDEVTWALLKETTDEGALKRFNAQYPNSALRRDADARIAALEAAQAAKPVPPSPDEVTWGLLKETTDEAALKRFTAQYPNSALRKDAEARIAALETAAKAVPPPAAATDPHELARTLQFELKRVGCFNGAVNGEFDDATKAAWHKFAKQASVAMPDDLSSDAIKAVRQIDKRICPLVCPDGQRPDGDRCVVTVTPHPHQAVVPTKHCVTKWKGSVWCLGPNGWTVQ
jgi:ribosomal protein S12